MPSSQPPTNKHQDPGPLRLPRAAGHLRPRSAPVIHESDSGPDVQGHTQKKIPDCINSVQTFPARKSKDPITPQERRGSAAPSPSLARDGAARRVSPRRLTLPNTQGRGAR